MDKVDLSFIVDRFILGHTGSAMEHWNPELSPTTFGNEAHTHRFQTFRRDRRRQQWEDTKVDQLSGKKYCAMANIILSSFFVFVCLFVSSKVDCNKCFKWCLCNSWGWIVILPHSKRPDVATGWSLFKRRSTEQDSAQRGSCSCLRGWQATKTKTERCHCPHSSSQRRVGG